MVRVSKIRLLVVRASHVDTCTVPGRGLRSQPRSALGGFSGYGLLIGGPRYFLTNSLPLVSTRLQASMELHS